MTLRLFENEIDPVILKRGLDYFTRGMVLRLDEMTPGVYEACVEGTQDYITLLSLKKNGEIAHHHCTCPYDWGKYCKHEAAVLYAIRQHRGINMTSDSTAIPFSLRELGKQLGTCKKDTLVALLIAAASNDAKLCKKLCAQYSMGITDTLLEKETQKVLAKLEINYDFDENPRDTTTDIKILYEMLSRANASYIVVKCALKMAEHLNEACDEYDQLEEYGYELLIDFLYLAFEKTKAAFANAKTAERDRILQYVKPTLDKSFWGKDEMLHADFQKLCNTQDAEHPASNTD